MYSVCINCTTCIVSVLIVYMVVYGHVHTAPGARLVMSFIVLAVQGVY